ncbi:MAG: hypothetical protein EAZ31_11280, partial [Cytophagia bacterium]
MHLRILPLIDETYSHLFFSGKGFWTSLTNYTTTNNHIFYNILTSFFDIFIVQEVLAMRFVSLICFWILLGYIFWYLQKNTNFEIAFWAILLVGLGFSQSVFSVQGRGYMLMSLCSFGAVHQAISLKKDSFFEQKKSQTFFIFWHIAGLFTSPVFVYTTIGIYGYFFFKASKKTILSIFISGILVILGTFLVYLPTFLYNGFGNFLAAHQDNLQPTSYIKFMTYILPICVRELIIYLIGFPTYFSFFIFALLLFLLFYFYQKIHTVGKAWLQYIGVSLGIMLVFIIFTKTFPLYRIWTYYGIFWAIICAFLLVSILPKTNTVGKVLIALGIFAGSFVQFEYAIGEFYDKNTVQYCEKLRDKFQQMAQKDKKTYLSKDAFYGIFWLRQAGKAHLIV